MMRRKVTIVLNEREPDKAQAAMILEQRLHSDNLLVERLQITNDVFDVVMARSPDILILDYVLGDVGTGLDMLALFKDLPEHKRPAVIFFTDEPSVQVAVETLRNGAEHYLEIGRASAFEQLVELCNTIAGTHDFKRNRSIRTHLLSDCSLASSERKRAVQTLQQMHAPFPYLFFLEGAKGSGRETLLTAWAQSRSSSLHPRTIRCHHYKDSLASLFDVLLQDDRYPATCIIIKDVEYDDHELRSQLLRLSGSIRASFQHCIAVCVERKEDAMRLGMNSNHLYVRLPSVNEYPEDAEAFVLHLLSTQTHYDSKTNALDKSALLSLIQKSTWPGELQELSSVVQETVLRTLYDHLPIEEAFNAAKEAWENDHAPLVAQPDVRPFTLVALLHQYNGSMRQVAAHLGYTPESLHQLLDVYRSFHDRKEFT